MNREVCSRAVDRLLKNNIDFNQIIEANTGTWVDETFNFPDAVFWKDRRPEFAVDDESERAKTITTWERISDVFPADSYSLWGTTAVSPKDPI